MATSVVGENNSASELRPIDTTFNQKRNIHPEGFQIAFWYTYPYKPDKYNTVKTELIRVKMSASPVLIANARLSIANRISKTPYIIHAKFFITNFLLCIAGY